MAAKEKAAVDEYEVLRSIVQALEGLPAQDQERVLRWTREKLGLSSVGSAPAPSRLAAGENKPLSGPMPATGAAAGAVQDIRTFIERKRPVSDVHFAASVAYYYQFEAPENVKRDSITAEDLQDACRTAGRDRLHKPAQTLVNAYNQGFLEKAGDRGSYRVSTVGENLVAIALPGDAGQPQPSKQKRAKKRRKQRRKKKARA
jgi:hypothetical protein